MFLMATETVKPEGQTTTTSAADSSSNLMRNAIKGKLRSVKDLTGIGARWNGRKGNRMDDANKMKGCFLLGRGTRSKGKVNE